MTGNSQSSLNECRICDELSLGHAVEATVRDCRGNEHRVSLIPALNVTRVILAEEIDEDGCYVIKRVQEHIPDRTFVVRTATTMTAKQIMAMCFNEWDLYERGYPKDLCLVGLAGDGFRKNTVLSEDWRTGDLSSDVTDADMWIVDRIIFELYQEQQEQKDRSGAVYRGPM